MDKKTLEQLIGKYDKKELVKLISYIVNRSETGQQALLDYCQKNSTKDNQALIIEKQIRKHWNKAAAIIRKFDMYGGGPQSDEEDACDELEKVAELAEQNTIDWKVRKSILDEMLELVASDNSGFTDYLVDIALVMCVDKSENLYLAEYLEKYGSSYYKGLAAQMFLKNGEDEKFLENKKANLQYGSDYLELAKYYEDHGDKELAVKIVQDGIDKVDTRLDEMYNYLFRFYKKKNNEKALEQLYAGAGKRRWNKDTITELMYEYYKEKKNYEKQKETLLAYFGCANSRKLMELYQNCKQELTEDDFSANENNILKTIKERNLSTYFDIILEKGESREVLDYLLQSPRYRGFQIDEAHYFSKRLAGEYPREIAEMYWKEVNYYVILGKEKNYMHAVNVLKEVRKIMKSNHWTDEFAERYKSFREENKRKRLLMKMLESF